LVEALERAQRAPGRTPVLSVSAEIPNGAAWCASTSEVDGYLAQSFHPTVLCEAVRSLAAVCAGSGREDGDGKSELQVLDTEGLLQQLAFDQQLVMEIIDLFLIEGPQQVIEMREALAADEFDGLWRAAHTIKGSFGTLHAGVARARAQELEHAAKQRDVVRCREILSGLEYDLEVLEPILLSLRNSPETA
jgi:HPt (histidine-containing phosphotransfer) domain-containing protein